MLNSLKYFWFQGWAIIFIAAVLMVFSSWCGPGFTYDSYDYLSAAKSFGEQRELLNADGSPFIFHAPLFPVFLSLLGDLTMLKLKLTNLIFLLLSLTLIGHIFRELISNKWVFLVNMVVFGLAVGTQMIHHFVWSEPLFLALFAVHNLYFIRYLKHSNKGDFYGLICAAFLLALTRNSGFFILLPGSVLLLVFSTRSAVASAVKYLALGSTGFIAWNVYVILFESGMQRVYASNPFLTGLWDNLLNYLDTISQWFIPAIIPLVIRLLLLLTLSIFLIVYLRKYVKEKVVAVLVAQSLFYIITMIVLISVDQNEIERLLAVIYPWLVGVLCILIDRMHGKLGVTTRRVLVVGLFLWMSYVVIRGVNNNVRWYQDRCVEQVSYDRSVIYE